MAQQVEVVELRTLWSRGPFPHGLCLSGGERDAQACGARSCRLAPRITAMAPQHNMSRNRAKAADQRAIEPCLELRCAYRLTLPDQIEVDSVVATGDGH